MFSFEVRAGLHTLTAGRPMLNQSLNLLPLTPDRGLVERLRYAPLRNPWNGHHDLSNEPPLGSQQVIERKCDFYL